MKLALAEPGRLHTPDWRRASSGAGNETLAAAFQHANGHCPVSGCRASNSRTHRTASTVCLQRLGGYKVHFTEGCDPDQPHFLLEVTTTAATTPDGAVIEDLHERLAERKALPSQHLGDKGYVDAEILAQSQQLHHIDIVGP